MSNLSDEKRTELRNMVKEYVIKIYNNIPSIITIWHPGYIVEFFVNGKMRMTTICEVKRTLG